MCGERPQIRYGPVVSRWNRIGRVHAAAERMKVWAGLVSVCDTTSKTCDSRLTSHDFPLTPPSAEG
jgi:hypothetical protein